MDLFETIDRRYSHRTAFTEDPVSADDVKTIVEAALKAPSGYNMQPVHYLVIDDPELLAGVAEIMPTPATKTAPLMIAVLTEHKETNGSAFEVEDYGAAVGYLSLAVTALGYAGVWMDGMTRDADANAKLRDLLDVPANLTLRTVFPVGVPRETGHMKPKRTFEEGARVNTF